MSGSTTLGSVVSGLTETELPLPAWLPFPAELPLPLPFWVIISIHRVNRESR